MSEKKYNILKAASWYTIGNILINGVSFFVLPIFTRLMSTHEYGIYSIYTSYLALFQTIILLGLSSTVALARYAKEVRFDSYVSTIITIPLLLSLGFMAVANVAFPIFGNILSMDGVLWNCLFISAGTGAVCNIIGARLVIEGRYKIYMASSAIQTIGNVTISLLLAYTVYMEHDVYLARVYGSTLSVVSSMVFLLLATKMSFSLNRINVKYALIWGIPLLFHTVATVVLTQSDRILIQNLDSYSSAGIYAVATTFVSIPLVLQQSIQQAWTPWFYGKLEAKSYNEIRWLNDRYIVLYSAIIIGFMLLVPDLIHLFIAQSYWSCIYCLVPLAISVFAELMYSIPTNLEYYHQKTTFIMKATLITVVLNIVLDVIFIKMFGYYGAAYATVLSKIILFLMHLHFARKLDNNWLFSRRVAVVCFAMLAVMDVVIVTTLEQIFVRYLILVVMLLPMGWYIVKNKELLLNELRGK